MYEEYKVNCTMNTDTLVSAMTSFDGVISSVISHPYNTKEIQKNVQGGPNSSVFNSNFFEPLCILKHPYYSHGDS